MDAVPVRAVRDGIRVARPQRARRLGQIEPERVRMLPEPVDVGRSWRASSSRRSAGARK
jgi:hypothetical protein